LWRKKTAVEFRVRWADKMQFKMASTVDSAWVLFYGVTRLHKSNYSVVPASYQWRCPIMRDRNALCDLCKLR